MRLGCGRSHKIREAKSIFLEVVPITPLFSVQFLRELRLLRDEAAFEGILPILVVMFLPAQRLFPFDKPFRLLTPFPALLAKLSCRDRGFMFIAAPRLGFWESKAYAANEQLPGRPLELRLKNDEDEADKQGVAQMKTARPRMGGMFGDENDDDSVD